MYTAGQSDIHFRSKAALRDDDDAAARPVGRHPRRCRADLSQHERVGVARRPRPDEYFARNPGLLRTRGSYERLATDNEDLNIVWPVRPTPGTNRALSGRHRSSRRHPAQVHRRLRADGLSRRSPAGGALRQRVRGRTGGESRDAARRSRTAADACRARRRTRAASSSPPPTSASGRSTSSNAPDGTLYIVDLYRGIIEHRISITEYLRDQILERRLDRGTGLRPHLPRGARDDDARRGVPLRERLDRRARERWRIRTAGGATPRSGCSSSAATVRRAGARCRWLGADTVADAAARAVDARRARCHRRRHWRRRSPTSCRKSDWPRSASPSVGSDNRDTRSSPKSRRGSTTTIRGFAPSSPRPLARCLPGHVRNTAREAAAARR